MRLIAILFFVSLFTVFTTHAQERKDCDDVKTGEFRIENEYGITIIKRTLNKQLEIGKRDSSEIIMDVVWLNDCTFQLRNAKLLKGPEFLRGNPTDILTVEIVGIDGNKLTTKTTANFTDFSRETTMEIIK